MKLSKLALLAAICCGTTASAAGVQSGYYQDKGVQQVGHCETGCDVDMSACDMGGCDGLPSYGCDSGCDSGCGLGGGCLGGECDLGDPFTLFGEYEGVSIGGWVQMGYHTAALPLFNSRPDEYQLHQAWLYAEKAIDTSNGFDIGGRIDYVYGTDSQDTQAFGISNNHWDNDWDNGTDYGHAMPQLYVEAGYGDLSVKAGHFYTIIGWEVVTAPDNFFYSHAYTMYNSEPFTHTGALATYNVGDHVSVMGGYVFGWDSGFEDNGDAFLGGVSVGLTDSLTVTYATVGGRFGDGNINRVVDGVVGRGENGYMHSIVADYAVSDNLQYIFQSDLLDTEDIDGATVRDTFGINQYLIYTLSDCWAVGTRFEWYQADAGVFNTDNDIYALTSGVNYKPHANVLVRPEIRWDWVDGDPTDILENSDDDQFTFGIDTIFLF
ncbi:hypothetical protein V7x_08510 [Crateriforma conspicua]|uniref:Porin n=2 Tax=Planctomycetaceae TaxID=126 RepID=A0A5C6FUS3_9PLAN|nr:porin [Crateriforma conspicua]TWU65305.1 hypothetical protein V7x_08510 [Crateriforma conspicua]